MKKINGHSFPVADVNRWERFRNDPGRNWKRFWIVVAVGLTLCLSAGVASVR
jgi:hypothetical protein